MWQWGQQQTCAAAEWETEEHDFSCRVEATTARTTTHLAELNGVEENRLSGKDNSLARHVDTVGKSASCDYDLQMFLSVPTNETQYQSSVGANTNSSGVLALIYVLLGTLSAVPWLTGVPLTAADRAEHYSHRPTMHCTTATAQLHSCRDANDAAVICSA